MMNATISTARFVLARGELLKLRGARGARIVNRRGLVWITQDGDRRDIVLTEGESFELDRDTPVIVQAFDCSTVKVSAPAPEDARLPGRGFVDWLRRLARARPHLQTAWA